MANNSDLVKTEKRELTLGDRAQNMALSVLSGTMGGLVDRVLPRGPDDKPMMSGARFKSAIATAFRANPNLAKCSVDSLGQSILKMAATGLEPGEESWLIPRGTECQVQLGYQGLQTLMRRHPLVADVWAEAVHEKDHFELDLGTDHKLIHRPCLRGLPGEEIGYYACLKLKDGTTRVRYMTKEEVEEHKKKYVRGESPAWKASFSAMARKTLILQLAKFAPKSRDFNIAQAIETNKPIHVTKEGEVVVENGGFVEVDAIPDEEFKTAPITVEAEEVK